MAFPNGEPNTQHSTNRVPVILIGRTPTASRCVTAGLVDARRRSSASRPARTARMTGEVFWIGQGPVRPPRDRRVGRISHPAGTVGLRVVAVANALANPPPSVRRAGGRERRAPRSRRHRVSRWRIHRALSRQTTRRCTSTWRRSRTRSSPVAPRHRGNARLAAMIFVSARGAGAWRRPPSPRDGSPSRRSMIWGPALEPDLVALALTALAVVLLDRRRELAPIAGFALVFAALAKPTALLPAAPFWHGSRGRIGDARSLWLRCGRRGRRGGGHGVPGLGPRCVRHVVTWNALSWSLDQAVSVAVIGVLVIGDAARHRRVHARRRWSARRVSGGRARDRRPRWSRGRDHQLSSRTSRSRPCCRSVRSGRGSN